MENKKNKNTISRREILKSLSTLPVLGAFGYGIYKKWSMERLRKSDISQELGLDFNTKQLIKTPTSTGKILRLGIIGCGIRGKQLLKACGFVPPELIDDWGKNPQSQTYNHFLAQENLNITINGVCDIFDVNANEALKSASNINRVGTEGKIQQTAKRYKRYTELLAAEDIDAVIIATPDHWHSKIAIDAARANKHIYLEKALTRTVEEALELRKTIKETKVIFQLGHQNRQTDSFHKAKQIIDKNILGKISLIEVCTNRNSPNGAWVYPIHPEGNPKTIDWEHFIEPTNNHPFSLERFFRWRCWWDYGTGLGGDLLTHEYDGINQIMNLGIPHSAVSSGGVYFYKDGREVPDVLHTAYEFPEKELTFMYSASLANDHFRGKSIMGHDATMKLSNTLSIYPNKNSTRYKNQLKNKAISYDKPMITYIPGQDKVDAISSATEQYFANRGLLYTYVNGKRVDTTHLHIKEWLNCIREKTIPSCNIDMGFQEAITAHMSTIAYKENRKVLWDAKNEKII